MPRFLLLISALLSAYISVVDAECANACNGHGKCTSYDMCICHRNWQANDCSERVCMHGLAHVDTPKGDLDGSGAVIAPDTGVVVDNSFQYPYGTTEQFPQMEDSDLRSLDNSAHYYMECSNKGVCDRSTGLCECFDGYDGVACQRASCPGYPASCSGHGVCKTAKQLAEADGGNVYKLWNKDATMGCECDAGYFGPDCSQRSCKVGVDPLYLDDTSTIKYSIFDFAVLTTDTQTSSTRYDAGSGNLFDDGTPLQGKGQWAIKFYDHSGEDWVTEPIDAGADCAAVTAALEGLPNDVIPAATLECIRTQKSDVADNLFVNDRSGVSSQDSPVPDGSDYKITYRMSIWDAYIYKKFGTNFQDVLSIKSKLGNQVYSPLLWLPGSMTLPFDATTAAGNSLSVIDIAVPSAVIAAQSAGSAEFSCGAVTDTTEAGYLKKGVVIKLVAAGGGATCAAAGYYTIREDAATNNPMPLKVYEAIPQQNSGDDCDLSIVSEQLMGTGRSMQPSLSADLNLVAVDKNTASGALMTNGQALGNADFTESGFGGEAKFTIVTATLTASDANKIRVGTQLQLVHKDNTFDCEPLKKIEDSHGINVFTVESMAVDGLNTKISVYEYIDTAESTADDCKIKIYDGNSPDTSGARVALSGDIYRVKFLGNPGKLRQPEIVTHLDGKRNSLMSTEYKDSADAAVDNEAHGEPQTNDVVITKVFTDGQQGEDKDYFADHCAGVTVTISYTDVAADPSLTEKIGTDPKYSADQKYADANIINSAKWKLLANGGGVRRSTEEALLKACLGDSDMTTTNNVDVYNWDMGSPDYPHLIKLVRTVTSISDGGYYVAIYYDGSDFIMLNPFTPPDALTTDVYEVYTTKGTLARVSSKAQAYFGFGQKKVITTNTKRMGAEPGWDGDVSCEVGKDNGFRMLTSGTDAKDDAGTYFINNIDTTKEGMSESMVTTYVKACVNKTDIITFLNYDYPALNPPKINLYTVDRLVKDKVSSSKRLRYGSTFSLADGSGNGPDSADSTYSNTDPIVFTAADSDMHFGTNVISLDLSTNWAVELNGNHADLTAATASSPTALASPYYIYKFIPAEESTYEYVAECSNRGLCDHETGVCECFTGYTSDNCENQDSLSL